MEVENQEQCESVPERTRETKLKWLNEKEEDASGALCDKSVKLEVETSPTIQRPPQTYNRIPPKMELKTLANLAKRPAINIDFNELSYTVRHDPSSRFGGKKEILKKVSGSFKAGQLTAIIGSSGAGKSTLMNILAGYVSAGVTGSIRMNDHPRQLKIFNKLSTYIMQDDLIQPHLTVKESLQFSAGLKLGTELSHEQKAQVVEEIIQTLGMEGCRDTRTERLSGGQRKRLSVALELVNNPPVIFLDEPTTGLDIVSITQLVNLLQKLARQGRTVICTIHQSTASIFKQFDRIYVMARGKCVYQGSHDRLVPFLSSVGLECPTTYNPADYIIEVIQGENQECVNMLSSEVQNGKLSLMSPEKSKDKEQPLASVGETETLAVIPKFFSEAEKNEFKGEFPISFSEQFSILFRRRLKQQLRNTTTLWIMFSHHFISGTLLGTIFLGSGNDANRPFDNFKFVISVVVFFMYTHIMCPVLLFPMEVRLLRREYFNRWYGLKSYFAAQMVASIPGQFIFGMIFLTICYLLSDQPMDAIRYLKFATIGLLLGFASEGWGLTVGSTFSVMNGSIIGPASIVPFLALSVYGMGFGGVIEPVMQFLMSMSYLRHGIVGFCTALYGENRALMFCDYEKTDYCHYKDPEILMKDLGVQGMVTTTQILTLFGFVALYRITAFLALRYRLTAEFSNKILNYLTKILREK